MEDAHESELALREGFEGKVFSNHFDIGSDGGPGYLLFLEEHHERSRVA
jgi:hypothetical protein